MDKSGLLLRTNFLIERENGNWLGNIVRDITEKKIYERSIEESEKRFRTLINTTTTSIFIIQNFKLIFVNKCGEELLGVTKENLRNVSILELFDDEHKLKIMDQLNDALEGKSTQQIEAKIKNRSGEEYWVEYSSGLIDVESKKLLIGTANDITKRKKAEESLAISKENYKELFEFSQNILKNERKRVAKDLHDIVGQRLTFAKINLEMMEQADKIENPKLKNAMENIIQVGRDLKNIVSSLTPSLIENFSLTEAVRRLIDEIKLNMDTEISFSYDENSVAKNKKIELNIFRIVQESINNSLKHSDADLIEIFLKIEENEITGKISDDGKGFDTSKLYSNSTGFGLNNMRERAELLGGNLYISSIISKGTSIEFKIPAMSKKKILLVDDHKMVREGLKMALEFDNNYDLVGEANNGLEGVEKAKELNPDIIIMDIDMPQLNGIDASVKIRELSPDVKILILTMLNDEELVFKALSAGVDGYIYKMAEISLFKDAVNSLAKGDTYFSQEVTSIVIKSHLRAENKVDNNDLTEREVEVLKLIVEGLTSQQIADKLFISYFTVAKHRKNIGDKLGIKNTAGLIKYGIENNLV